MLSGYLTKVDEHVSWFSAKSKKNKKYYLNAKILLTCIAATVPALTAFTTKYEEIKVLVIILSVLTAILVNITGIFRFKDNWMHYRNMCELLKSEKSLYENNAGKYKNTVEKESLFVETIEGFLRNENQQWFASLNDGKEPEAK